MNKLALSEILTKKKREVRRRSERPGRKSREQGRFRRFPSFRGASERIWKVAIACEGHARRTVDWDQVASLEVDLQHRRPFEWCFRIKSGRTWHLS